jgi:hypothetical protein
MTGGLGITGKDVTVGMSLDGVPQNIYDDVLSLEAEPMLEETSSSKLGKDGVDVDVEATGWRGTLEVEVSSSGPDELIDAIYLSMQSRLPYVISIGETTHYRDLTSKSYTYPNVKFTGIQKRSRSREKATITFNWKTGSARIPG